MSHDTYADVLKKRRLDAKIKQKDLADALKMHHALFSDVERGKRLPFTVSRSRQLAEYLEVDPAELMALAAEQRGIDADALKDVDIDVLIALILEWPTMAEYRQEELIRCIEGRCLYGNE